MAHYTRTNRDGLPIPEMYYVGDGSAFALSPEGELWVAPVQINGDIDWDQLGEVDSRADEYLIHECQVMQHFLLAARATHAFRHQYERDVFEAHRNG
jgi:hypothetical protein